MDEVVEKIAVLGLPGIIFVVPMAATVLTRTAIITPVALHNRETN